MATKDPFANINPKTVGYGKSGAHPFKKDDQYSYTHGVKDIARKFMATSKYSLETANLSKENVETIMSIIGEIVGKKDQYSPLNRYDEEKFRHQLEEAFRHNKLSREDIADAWKIWENFKK